jgi:drug/metabolite transporter (DMT)-like permease
LTYALGHLPATVTSVVLLTIAPLTAVFAFGIFGERMTLAQIAGGAFVIVGVWVVSRTAKVEARDYEPFSAIG